MEIIKKILGVVMLIITIPFGLLTMCYGTIVNSIIALVINTYYTGKLIHVGFIRQMRDLSFTLSLSLSMFAVVYGLTLLFSNHYVQISVGLIIGVMYFAIVCFVRKPQELIFVKSVLKK